jgi:Tfp pilus assembly protein PilF
MRHNKKFRTLLATAVALPLFGGLAACGEEQKQQPDTKALVANGERLLGENNLKGAETQFRLAAKYAPQDEAIHLQLARIYLKENQTNAAEAELIPLKQISMQSEQYHVVLAEVMARQGKAVELLHDVPAGSRSPEIESEIRSYRAFAELALGHTSNAKQMLVDAEQLNPSSVLMKLGKARLFVDSSDIASADRVLDEALAIAPKDSRVLDAKGGLALARHENAQAMKYFEQAVEADPRNVRALLHRGNLHLTNGELDAAERDAEATFRADTGNRNAALLQASVAIQKGDYARADAIFTRLRPLMDRLPTEAYLKAGIVKYHLNQAEQADTFLTKFVAQQHDKPEAYETLGAIALQRGDAKRAADMLAQAIKLDPKNASASELLEKARAEMKAR